MPVCQPSACTFCSALHDRHGVLHHVSGATVTTMRSTSLRSTFLRALCIPWQTPPVGPSGSSERTTFCQYTTANSHRKTFDPTCLEQHVFCAYVLHQLCALRSIRLCLAARWAKGVVVKTINLRTSERRPSTLAYKLARISARATSASTCLFANRLHALASKDMCTKPMTPKIQVAVELPATLMLLGDTEGWCCVSFALLSKRAPRRSCTRHRNAINQLGHQLMSVGGGRKKISSCLEVI